jgi:glycosyltransferase involved in cell wall biosynthesis
MPRVVLHGQLAQPELAALMRRCALCVLPSFYEGLPLVLVEALACGCRLLSTDLPGVRTALVPQLRDALQLVPTPRLIGVDQPHPADLPAFVDALERAVEKALDSPSPCGASGSFATMLESFRWGSVFSRVEEVWRVLMQRGDGV